jgi:hypothetical protein
MKGLNKFIGKLLGCGMLLLRPVNDFIINIRKVADIGDLVFRKRR